MHGGFTGYYAGTTDNNGFIYVPNPFKTVKGVHAVCTIEMAGMNNAEANIFTGFYWNASDSAIGFRIRREDSHKFLTEGHNLQLSYVAFKIA
jgi:hypothetical protein